MTWRLTAIRLHVERLVSPKNNRPRLFLSAVAFLVLLSVSAGAENETFGPREQPLRYRQIYVPVDIPDAWPRDGEKYIPVEAKQFQDWISQANANAEKDPGQQARITSAIYLARWKESRLVGSGQFEIKAPSNRATILPWEGVSLLFTDAEWKLSPPRSAEIGLWGGDGRRPAQLGLLVKSSGMLNFHWHLDSIGSPSEPPTFPLRFPPSTAIRFILDLPEGKRPSVVGGVVLSSEEVSEMPIPMLQEALPSGLHRWLIAMQGKSSATLYIEDMNPPSKITPAAVVHQQLNYYLSTRGIEFSNDIQLEAEASPPKLSILLNGDAHVTDISLGGQAVAWQIALADNGKDRLATIELPASFATGHTIRLSAWAPIQLDQLQELPTVRVQHLAWSTGTIELNVATSLELKEVMPRDCIQREVAWVEESESHRLVFDQLSPESRLDLIVGQHQPRVMNRAKVVGDGKMNRPKSTGAAEAPHADIELTGTIGSRVLTADCLIACQAKGGSFDEILVFSSEPLPDDAKWTDETSGERLSPIFEESRPTSHHVADKGGLWRIRFPHPRADAAVVRIQAEFPLENRQQIPLVMLSGYERQSGRVVLRVSADALWAIRQKRMVPAPLPPIDADASEPICAVYRYDPHQLAERDTEPHLELVGVAKHSVPRLVVVHVGMESAYSSDGAACHRVLYTLENHGKRKFEFSLPPSAELRSAWVNGRAITPQRSESDSELLILPLRLQDHTSNVLLEIMEDDVTIGSRSRISAPLPTVESPVLAGEWTIWTPTDYIIPDAIAITSTPPNWRRRIFGFLARPAQHRPFDIWNKYDWTSVWNESQRQDQAIGETRRLLERIGRRILEEGDNSHISWSGLFTQATDIAVQPDPLVVDYWSLAKQGIYANTRVTLPNYSGTAADALAADEDRAAAEHASVALNFLAERQLAILISRNRLILTTNERIAAVHPSPQSLELPGVFRSDDAILQTMFVVHSAAWDLVTFPEAILPADHRSGPVAGWHAFQVPISDSPRTVALVSGQSQRTWVGGAFLGAMGGGIWLRRRFPRILSGSLLVLVACCIVAPPTLTSIASAALFGVLTVMLGLFLWQPLDTNGPTAPQFSGIPKFLKCLTITAVTVLAPSRPGLAQELTDTSTDENSKTIDVIHPVLIPIDADGRIAESKRYVGEEFLRELVAQANHDPSQLGDWFIRRSRYVGRLAEQSAVDVGISWTAEFEIDALVRNATMHLPLRRSDFADISQVTLNGMPVRLGWHSSGGCTLRIAESGTHRLILHFRPTVKLADCMSSVRIRIPRLADAELEIDGPVPPQLEVQGVRLDGKLPTAEVPLRRSLIDVDQLNIGWGSASAEHSVETHLQVDRLLWLHVQPDGIWMEGRFVFTDSGADLKSLTIQADRRWKRVADGDSDIDEVAQAAANHRTFVVSLPDSIADGFAVPFRFQCHAGSFVGNLDLGELPSTSLPIRNSWVAMTVYPTLAAEIASDGPAEPVDASDFASKWGEEEVPHVASQSQNPHARWQLVLRPQMRLAAVEENVAVIAELSKLNVRYEADVEPSLDERFQFRLQVPETLIVNELTVTQDGQPIAVRWSRLSPTRLNVFFASSLAKPYHLSLSGHVSFEPGGVVSLPVVRSDAKSNGPRQVSVFRNDQVLVEVIGAKRSNGIADSVLPGELLGYIGGFELGEQANAARVRIRPNETEFEGETFTTLTEAEDGWQAAFACRLRVTQGEVGTLILAAPASWEGPYTTQPAAETTVIGTDGSNIRLAIRLPQAVSRGRELQLRIASPISSNNDQASTAPIIRLEGASEIASYVAVPLKIVPESVQRQSEGINPVAKLPAWRSEYVGADLKTYRVVSNSAVLKIQPQTPQVALSSIALADTSVLIAPDSGQILETSFALRPEGVSECVLRVPKKCQLVEVTVSGHRPLMSRLNKAAWQIALGSPYLAQLVKITLKVPAGNSEDSERIVVWRPQLLVGDRVVPVEVNLWSVWRHAALAKPGVEAAAPNHGVDLAMLRLEKLLSVAEESFVLALHAPAPDGANWLGPWAARLHIAANDLRLKLAEPANWQRGQQVVPQTGSPRDDIVGRADELVSRISKQLSPDASKPQQIKNEVHHRDDQPWLLESMPGLRGSYYVSDGSNDWLMLDNGELDGMAWLARLSIATGMALSALGLAWLGRWFLLGDLWWRWPAASVMIAGLVAWASITPSLIGLMIIGVSLVIVIRPGWASSH